MADFNAPVVSDSYTNILAYLKNRDLDLAKMLDPATTTPTNLPTNAIRYNSANSYFEKYNGATWSQISLIYTQASVDETISGDWIFTGVDTRLPSHHYRGVFDGSGNVYDNYYFMGTGVTNTFANLRVKSGAGLKSLYFGGDGTFAWDGSTVLTAANVGSYALPIGGGTLTGALAMGANSISISPAFATTTVPPVAGMLLFDGSYNDNAYGPNKIRFYGVGAWLAGIGIHSDSVAYYSGGYHRFYTNTTAYGAGGIGSLSLSFDDVSLSVNVPTSTFGSTASTANTVVKVLAADSYNAGVEAYGANQGTGYYYAGQSTTYGGGFFYNGDASPAFATGEVADQICFFQMNNGAKNVVFRYSYTGDTVSFVGGITTGADGANNTTTLDGNGSIPLIVQTNSGSPWGIDLYRTDSIHTRVYNNGSGWYFEHRPIFAGATPLDSSNYNSYSPTLTGGGASGSWGISVTGSSAACTGNSATAFGLQSYNMVYGLTGQSGSSSVSATQNVYEWGQYHSGFWDVTGAAWTPNTNWFWGATFAHTSNTSSYNYSGQLAFQNGLGGNGVYARTISAGSPSGWSLLLSSGNYNSYAMAGAGYSANQNLNTSNAVTFSSVSVTNSYVSGGWYYISGAPGVYWSSYQVGIRSVATNRMTTYYDGGSTTCHFDVHGGVHAGQTGQAGDITAAAGQGRFGGWYNGTGFTGQAVEIGMSSGQGYIFVYNRGTPAYGTLNIAASSANLQFSGSTINATSGTLQQSGNTVIHAGNWKSYVMPNAAWVADNGGYNRWYFGANTNSYWRGYGSTPHEWRNGADTTLGYWDSSGNLYVLGDVTAYYTSDNTLKENLQLIADPFAILDKVDGWFFDWKDEYLATLPEGVLSHYIKKHDVGLIANEWEDVLPSAVALRNGHLGIQDRKVIPVLVAAIKKLRKEVVDLRGRLQ